MIRCKYDPFEDEEQANLNFPFNPDAPTEEQVANLVFRFSEYRKAHRHMSGCLSTISDLHYQKCDLETLLNLKQPVQVLLYAREVLQSIDDALGKDIDLCKDFLLKLQQESLNGCRENESSSEEDSEHTG